MTEEKGGGGAAVVAVVVVKSDESWPKTYETAFKFQLTALRSDTLKHAGRTLFTGILLNGTSDPVNRRESTKKNVRKPAVRDKFSFLASDKPESSFT